jgi:hypothetical protein
MIQLLFSIYLILVSIWLIFSVVVLIFSLRFHFFSVTNWGMIILYIIISLQILNITGSSLTKYASPSSLNPFSKTPVYEYRLSR